MQCLVLRLPFLLLLPSPLRLNLLISINFLVTAFILNLRPNCLIPSAFPPAQLPPDEVQPALLIPLEIMIVEHQQLLVALTLAEVVHVELADKAFELRVPEVERQDLALE